jgi:hypothetical protein
MALLISDEDVEAIAQKVIELLAAGATKPAAATLRNAYSVEEFRKEVLGGHRTAQWVQNQCARKRIKTVTRHPYRIPQSEAVRFLNAGPAVFR